MTSTEVVIAGAGIAGIATAYALVENHGVTDVTLVDPRPPLTLTSDKSGANYRDWWPQRPMVDLVRRSIDLMRSLHRSGAPFKMNRRGYLYVTSDVERARALADSAEAYRTAGLAPIRIHGSGARSASYEPAAAEGLTGPEGVDILLSPSFLHQCFPHLATVVSGAIHARNAGSVDPVALGRFLLAVAQKRGARLLKGSVCGIESTGGRVRAVLVATADGSLRIDTGHFVNAAGPFLRHLQELAGATTPIVTVLQQKVWIPDPLGALPPDAPFTVCLDPMDRLPPGLHIKPESVAGQPGIKLGWAFNRDGEEPVWEPRHAPEFPALVLRGASRVVRGLEAYLSGTLPGMVQASGYYMRSPDELPLIGPAGPDGVTVVGGLAGYGAMAACAVGEIAAAWIVGAPRPHLASDFEPARFENPNYLTLMRERRESTGAL